MKKINIYFLIFIIILNTGIALAASPQNTSSGQSINAPGITITLGKPQKAEDISLSLQLLIFMTILTIAPTLLIMLTSFTRIVIVLSFTRNALATQQAPPNQVLIGLSLFLTIFIMGPVFREVNEKGIKPYMDKKITFQEAVKEGSIPIRKFMFKQTREEDLAVFVDASHMKRPKTLDDIPTDVLIPSFIISELRTAFQIGFLIFIPFLLVDVVVSTTLMAMGMMMLPPMMISLPLKLLLFIMVDGWNLIVRAIVLSFK